ncbi:MAG TPA: tRNA pseudouridine(38-40) synthase TruA [Vicinamibacteria bacterium]|nr:tRNA pseudouridine(38-40) synthase TruA [Vicinamibacteria bacterium]
MGHPPNRRSYRVTLAYDGTDFLGWQAQRAGAGRTVQGTLEEALARLGGGARVAVAGAGRTDAGVHALGQVVSFSLPTPWDSAHLQRALNALLPPDLRALDAAPCAEGFHARRDARSKLYRYVLDSGGVQLPQRRRFAGHVAWRLDETRMRGAAALFVGRHDFASLASAGSSVKTTVRTVSRSEIRRESGEGMEGRAGAPAGGGATFVYEVEADGFLRKMVRSLVGALVEVGRGAADLAHLEAALRARDRRAWPAPAAARGLTLVSVRYVAADPEAPEGRE